MEADRGSRRASSLNRSPMHGSAGLTSGRLPDPGSYELAVTATDDQGRQQPTERPSNRVDDYEWNQRQLIQVTVK